MLKINKKLELIFNGLIAGFFAGVITGTFLYDSLFRTVFPDIYFRLQIFEFFWVNISIMLVFTILGGLIGAIIASIRKETASTLVEFSKIKWIFYTFLLAITFSFYAFSFTTTYECSVRTKGDIRLEDNCYSKKLICEKVASPEIADSCYYNLAEFNVDSRICSKILATAEINKCLTLVAIRESQRTPGSIDLKYCDQLEDQEGRDGCYASIDSWKNPNICEKIINQSSKNGCYYSAAEKLCDESLCEKITNSISSEKDNCLGAVKLGKTQEYRPGGNCRFFQEEQQKLAK